MNICMVKNCENDFCIYNNKKICILSEISINEMGICEDSISIHFPPEILDKYKKIHLKNLEKRYGQWK